MWYIFPSGVYHCHIQGVISLAWCM